MMINGVVDCSARSMFANRMKPWKPGGYKKFYGRFSSYIQMMAGYLSPEKFCSKCGETKVVSEFYVRDSGAKTRRSVHRKRDSYCKDCVRSVAREWRRNNLLRARKNSSDWVKRNPIAQRVRKYGLTRESYLKMLEEHNNACAICKTEKNNLQVDHCHKTGKVRGLLCVGCNTALGKFADSVDRLKVAIAYLER